MFNNIRSMASSRPSPATAKLRRVSLDVEVGTPGVLKPDRQDDNATPLRDEQTNRKRMRERIIKELVETEKTYVKDLHTCIHSYLKETRTNAYIPKTIEGKAEIIFGNIEEIYAFHNGTFMKELQKCGNNPKDVGQCFVKWADGFDSYIPYCLNKEESNNTVVKYSGSFYESAKKEYKLDHTISDYLIKPVQRLTKYQLLLKDLKANCDDGKEDVQEGLDVMLDIQREVNYAMEFTLMTDPDIPLNQFGKVVLAEHFQIKDYNDIIKKVKERYVFLTITYLVFCIKSSKETGKGKYIYKNVIRTFQLGVTEGLEDDCKFAVWRGPAENDKISFLANSPEIKNLWIKKLRQVIEKTLNRVGVTEV